MKRVHKEYEWPFLLEPTKLTRLMGAIHDSLDGDGRQVHPDHFEAFLTGNRREEMNTVEELLALDNSRNRRINRLVILSSASSPNVPRPDYEIQVDFAGPKAVQSSTTANTQVISISVRSDDSGWAGRTLSEVEEQIERTAQSASPLWIAALALVVILIVLLLRLPTERSRSDGIDAIASMWLRKPDLEHVRGLLEQHSILTEEDVRAVATRQLRNVLDVETPKPASADGRSNPLILLGIPLLVVAGCVITLMLSGYPRAVFLWGDEVARYKNILQRRKILWSLILTITVGGILSQLFYEGAVSFVRR